MKLINLFLLALLITVSFQLKAQDVKKRTSKVEVTKKYNPQNNDYLYKTEKVVKIFKSGSIPSDFPKATWFDSNEAYKAAVIGYVENNYELFNHDELAKHNIFVKKRTKNTLSEQEYRKKRTDAIDRTKTKK